MDQVVTNGVTELHRRSIRMTTLAVQTRNSGRVMAVLAPVAAALIVWVIADPVAGVDLATSSGHVGIAAVVAVSLMVSAAGLALLTVLERRTARPRRTWTIVAVAALVLSLLGPLGAKSGAAGAALAAMHLAVGVSLILGLRRVSRDR